jgi:hypothetical protein
MGKNISRRKLKPPTVNTGLMVLAFGVTPHLNLNKNNPSSLFWAGKLIIFLLATTQTKSL